MFLNPSSNPPISSHPPVKHETFDSKQLADRLLSPDWSNLNPPRPQHSLLRDASPYAHMPQSWSLSKDKNSLNTNPSLMISSEVTLAVHSDLPSLLGIHIPPKTCSCLDFPVIDLNSNSSKLAIDQLIESSSENNSPPKFATQYCKCCCKQLDVYDYFEVSHNCQL
ncbi:hypothetical protein O181_118105 [Austropuccinia psidii MF-1]|uniref:FLZ-type domain-containing protein n=1 Tax=Austropuccinia psidii MF-1 TaxID=1389203 RepID=A0A9Q3PZ18_9BASI|nr:hypothetical protein [Austropuccinia psidii MF-1]